MESKLNYLSNDHNMAKWSKKWMRLNWERIKDAKFVSDDLCPACQGRNKKCSKCYGLGGKIITGKEAMAKNLKEYREELNEIKKANIDDMKMTTSKNDYFYGMNPVVAWTLKRKAEALAQVRDKFWTMVREYDRQICDPTRKSLNRAKVKLVNKNLRSANIAGLDRLDRIAFRVNYSDGSLPMRNPTARQGSCPKCKGTGCSDCNNTGKLSLDLIEADRLHNIIKLISSGVYYHAVDDKSQATLPSHKSYGESYSTEYESLKDDDEIEEKVVQAQKTQQEIKAKQDIDDDSDESQLDPNTDDDVIDIDDEEADDDVQHEIDTKADIHGDILSGTIYGSPEDQEFDELSTPAPEEFDDPEDEASKFLRSQGDEPPDDPSDEMDLF